MSYRTWQRPPAKTPPHVALLLGAQTHADAAPVLFPHIHENATVTVQQGPGTGSEPMLTFWEYFDPAGSMANRLAAKMPPRTPYHLLAHSMHVPVAVKRAAEDPYVLSLTLVSPVPSSRVVEGVMNWLGSSTTLETMGGCLRGPFRRLCRTSHPLEFERLYQAWRAGETSYPLVIGQQTAVATSPYEADALRVRVPTTLIYGEHDPLVSAADIGGLARRFNTVRVVCVEDASHLPLAERPQLARELMASLHDISRSDHLLNAREEAMAL